MVKVRVPVRVLVRVRVLSASICLPNVRQICSPHFTHGQWLYGMMLAVRTYIVVYTLANTT